MGRERFKECKRDSFFGSFVYEQVVPKDHFPVKLNEVVPWQRFTYKLVKYYRGKAKEGRPPYDPAISGATSVLRVAIRVSPSCISEKTSPSLIPIWRRISAGMVN